MGGGIMTGCDISGRNDIRGTIRSKQSNESVKKVVLIDPTSRCLICVLRVKVSPSIHHYSRTTRDIQRSNAVDDIIRYIKTLLTRLCVSPRMHRCESEVACNSVCFWIT